MASNTPTHNEPPQEEPGPANLDGTPKKQAGRPTRLTKVLVKEIVASAFVGIPHARIREGMNIKEDTWNSWLQRGKHARKGSVLHSFAQGLQDSKLRSERHLLMKIQEQANQGDWRAAAHLLACRWPDEWSIKRRTELEAKIASTGPVTQILVTALPETADEGTKNLLAGLQEDGTSYENKENSDAT